MTNYYLYLFLALAIGLGAVIWMVLTAERKEKAEEESFAANSLLITSHNSEKVA